MTSSFEETLSMLAKAAEPAEDDWWIIGSAAVVLHGGEVPHVKDVDLMMSARDADAFLQSVSGARRRAMPSDRFHSPVFGVWSETPIPVEVFGGFRTSHNGVCREVSFSTREAMKIGGVTIYIPSAPELIALLHSFGRSKDLERANLLLGHLGS